MTVKVEVSLLDAEMLARLKAAKAVSSMTWDSNLSQDVTIRIEINYPLGQSISPNAIAAINECVNACVASFAVNS